MRDSNWSRILASVNNNQCVNAVGSWCLDGADKGGVIEKSEGEPLLVYNKVPNMGEILRDANICSRNVARNNGWDFKISEGYSEYNYGKKGKSIICWFPSTSTIEFILATGRSQQ